LVSTFVGLHLFVSTRVTDLTVCWYHCTTSLHHALDASTQWSRTLCYITTAASSSHSFIRSNNQSLILSQVHNTLTTARSH